MNLVQASLHMMKFLQEVEKHPSLYSNVHLLQEAVRRYEEVWLPLVAKHGPGLVPPLDVEHPGRVPPYCACQGGFGIVTCYARYPTRKRQAFPFT